MKTSHCIELIHKLYIHKIQQEHPIVQKFNKTTRILLRRGYILSLNINSQNYINHFGDGESIYSGSTNLLSALPDFCSMTGRKDLQVA